MPGRTPGIVRFEQIKRGQAATESFYKPKSLALARRTFGQQSCVCRRLHLLASQVMQWWSPSSSTQRPARIKTLRPDVTQEHRLAESTALHAAVHVRVAVSDQTEDPGPQRHHAVLVCRRDLFNYLSFIFSIAYGQRMQMGLHPAQAVWLFLLSNILLILTFAAGWQVFDVYGTSAGCNNNTDSLDSLHFSTTIFATVGFGDLLPCNAHGKMLFIAESIVGSTHFGIFITLVFSRVIFPAKN